MRPRMRTLWWRPAPGGYVTHYRDGGGKFQGKGVKPENPWLADGTIRPTTPSSGRTHDARRRGRDRLAAQRPPRSADVPLPAAPSLSFSSALGLRHAVKGRLGLGTDVFVLRIQQVTHRLDA